MLCNAKFKSQAHRSWDGCSTVLPMDMRFRQKKRTASLDDVNKCAYTRYAAIAVPDSA